MPPVIKLTDIAKAKAFALWAKSAVGIEPQIVNIDDQYLEIDFTQPEKKAWSKYLDNALLKGIRKPVPGAEVPTVQIRFGEVLLPWAGRYIIAIAIAGLIIGRMSKR